jgi:tRNA 5-methylaminomethyl-2-thiouridine biosynthesis bifunctional protein
LPVGLVAPHTSPDDSLISRLSRAGVRAMHQAMQHLLQEGTDWSASGVQERRLPGKTRKGGAPVAWQHSWPQEGSMWTRSAPPPAPEHALWHEKGAWLRPAALVNALLRHPNIRWQGNTPVSALTHANGQWQVWQEHTLVAQASHVVVASGPASQQLIGKTCHTVLPLQALRGQLSWGLLHDSPQAPLPASPVNGHGSFVAPVPTPEGPAWFAGSTYDRHHPHAEVLAADHADNLTRLNALLPDTAASLQPAFANTVRGWAGVRASVPDRLPLVGPIANAPPGLWVNAGMGSRGLTLALLCGELLAARWHQEPLPIEPRLAQALDALRYQTQSTPA